MSTARRALGLLPTCASTGIGSLPHTQGELALQMAFQNDIPYLPQLPKMNPAELMIPAALEGLPGLHFDDEGLTTVDIGEWRRRRDRTALELDEAIATGHLGRYEPSTQACRSWRPFLFEVEGRRLSFAKVQLAGPATVRWVTKTTEGRPAAEVAELDEQIFRLILARAVAMAKAVRARGATPLLFLDEPGLYTFQRANLRHLMVLRELKVLVAAVQREGALVGLHCCSNTDWASILELGLDVLSIDARLSLDAVIDERESWLRFVESGATLALGIIPTDLASDWNLSELCDSVEASLRATEPPGASFEALLARVLLTPACGLGMRSVADAERLTQDLRGAQRRLRELVRA